MTLSRRFFLTRAPAIVAAASLMPISAKALVAIVAPLMDILPCDGRMLDKREYSHLFDAIRYAYGGMGNTFNLPDLRGRLTDVRPSAPLEVAQHYLVTRQLNGFIPVGTIIVGTSETEQARIPKDNVPRFVQAGRVILHA